MLNAAFVGWLIGKAIVGLVRGAARLVEGAAYLVGTGCDLLATAGRRRRA